MKKIMVLLVGILLIAGCSKTNAPEYVQVDELRGVAKAVGKLTEEDKNIIRGLAERMDADGLAGISAPQLGIEKRIMIVKNGKEKVVMVDPAIIESADEQTRIETSPNAPGLHGLVKRSRLVKLQYLDQNGKKRTISAEGAYAGTIQQQFEYLQGNFFIDNARSLYYVQK